MLKGGHKELIGFYHNPTSPEYLQAVAQIMISIHVLGDTLKDQSSGLELNVNENTRYFIREAEKCLRNDSLNDEKTSSGPIWYLVRYIIRTYGVSTLLNISKIDMLDWVVPHDNFSQVW